MKVRGVELSEIQKGIYFECQTGAKNIYNISTAIKIQSKLDIIKLKQSLEKIVQEQVVLRSHIEFIDERLSMVIDEEVDTEIQYYNVSNKVNKYDSLNEIVNTEIQYEFDLSKAPLFRIALIEVDEEEFVLTINLHHIIADGVSLDIFMQKLFTYYSREVQNKPIDIKEDSSFLKFVEIENEKLSTGQYSKQKAYWTEKVKDTQALDFPRDFSSAHNNLGIGKEKVFPISKELMQKIEKTAQQQEVTPFIFCLAAFSVLMKCYCNEEDVVVASPFTNRPGFDYDQTIGCFIYTLPLKSKIASTSKFKEVVQQLYDEMINAYRNIGYPNNLIARECSSSVYTGMQSIFDISFVYDRYTALDIEGLKIYTYDMDNITFPGNMMVILTKMPNEDMVKIQYKPDIYSEEMIEILGKRLEKILEIIVEEPEIHIKDINLLLPGEKQKILYDFNKSEFFEYKPTHIINIFESRVKQYGNHTALIYENGSMTYEEVNCKANQLAHNILKLKSRDNEVIGVQLKRSKEMVFAILGILKAGCAYVPIENYYPTTRKEYIFKDANISIFITTKDLQYDFCKDKKMIFMDEAETFEEDASDLKIDRNPYDLAYIEYTSGSTGEPKGVMIENHSVVNTILDLERRFPVEENDVYLYKTPFSFDISGTEVYGWFAGKGALCILEHEGEKNPQLILEYIEKYQVTHINFVPSMFSLFLELFNEKKNIDKLKSLKWIFVGGEAITPDVVERFFKLNLDIRLENVYGPTECTMWASNYSIKGCEDVSNMSIGNPLNEIRWYVVGENNDLQMVGVPGELCLSGVGLARGYLNKEELTQEKFCDNPFYDEARDPSWYKKMYRTGDLARWLPDGSIEFMGRIDFQVKIAGVRMELGEIENALTQHEEIIKAVVVTKQSASQLPVLYAYYLSEKEIPATTLRTFLSKYVPAYMIPAFYTHLEELPLNSSGKINRKVLEADAKNHKQEIQSFEAPETELENIIAQVWKEVLEIEQVGIDNNFFEIGGYSLAAIQIQNKLKNILDIEISVTTLFQFPTIRLLAEHLVNDKEVVIEDRKKYFKRDKKNICSDIAIIGMAVDVPGADNIRSYWNNLKNEKECIHFYSDDELRELGIDDEMLANDHYVKAKGRVEDIDYFDPVFFEYTPSEVRRMSPQLRLLYRGTWQALEDAGYYPGSTKDKMGIFIGGSDDFQWYTKALGNNANYSDMYQAFTMSTNHFLATRLAYKFDIKGPVFSSLTGCSTTLVTSHLACQSLILGECDIAIAGGITVELPNDGGYMYEEGMMFSPDGHCRPFDAEAKGTVFSNGMGIVVLKRLDEALEAGDHIYAVIKGSAINNDGSQKVGFAAPSVEGQAEVIREAYKRAEIDPETVGYVEAHGTGTILGDPIEVESLTKAFATDKKGYCVLGSVKGNIGHTDTAAGVVGLIKVALSLDNKFIPATKNYNIPNPKICFEKIPFVVNGFGMPWHRKDNIPLRAGINSFGVGGTNAHMVLEEAPPIRKSSKAEEKNLLVFSAKTENALKQNIKETIQYINVHRELNFSDVSWTLMTGRKSFSYRKSIVIDENFDQDIDVDEFLEDILEEECKASSEKKKIYFMFSGQGSQYQGIGRDLYNETDTYIGKKYHEYIDEILSYLSEAERKEFVDVIYGDADSTLINQTKYSQFALFMTEYTVANILMDLGVKPIAFIGHSIGEVTAAAVAGVWSLKDAVKIIRARGDLMQKQKTGAMLAVMEDAEEVEKMLIDGVSLALNNTSARCVVGGTKEKIAEFEKIVTDKGIKATILRTSHAFHTYMMEEAANEFEEFLGQFKMKNPSIPIISNVTGKWVEEDEMNQAKYWAKHIINPVRFDKDLEVILQEENAVCIETGAGRSLCTFALQHQARKASQSFINVVRHPKEKENDLAYMYKKIGMIWSVGVQFEWEKLATDKVRNKVSLPVYNFEKKPYPIKVPLMGSNMQTSPETEIEVQIGEVEKAKLNNIDALENYIIEAYKEVLGFEEISREQDFFQLGGDSLKVVSLSNVIASKLGIKVAVSDIFKYNTPKKLGAYVKTLSKGADSGRKIIPLKKSAYYEVSSAQKRMYGLYLLDKNSIAYNLPSATIIEGVLNEDKVREVSKELLKRHEALRTSFEIRDNQIVQVISDNIQESNMQVKFTEQKVDTDEELTNLINNFVKPFDLSKAPLFRLEVVKVSDQKSILLFDVHHIIADGTSVEILTRDFNTLYVSSLSPLEVQYKDFAAWQNKYLQSEEMMESKAYWKSQFEDDIPVLELPYDRERPEIKTFKGNRIHFDINKKLTEKLLNFTHQNGGTMYMSLLSVWYVLLARYSGQEDIVVGSPVAGRMTEEVTDTMGMFVNMLAMRNKPVSDKKFIDFFNEVKENTVQALKNQNYQFDDLIEQLGIRHGLDRNALFDVCFDYQNMETYDLDIEGMKIIPVKFDTNTASYDLVLTCQQNKDNEIECFIDYASDLFNESTILRMIDNYCKLLESIMQNSDTTIGALDIVSNKEKEDILNQIQETKVMLEMDMPLHQLFEKNVDKHPNKIALITAQGETFTYDELNQKANKIAHRLISIGVKKDDLIGLMTKRDEYLLAGMLGILKAGAAYVPIDGKFPKERIKDMLEMSQPKAVLVDEVYEKDITYDGCCINCRRIDEEEQMSSNPNTISEKTDLAYVIFTSGSTGRPKGVMVNHSSVINFINDMLYRKIFKDDSDRVICVTTLSFDIFGFESIVPMCTGHSIYMADETEQLDAALVARKIVQYDVTHILSTVSRIKVFVDHPAFTPALKKLKCILSGGENYPLKMLEQIKEKSDADIWNMYGPTETTIWSTSKELTHANEVNIGKPIINTQVFILNSDCKLQPYGVYGEICISGEGLARGYYQNQTETDKKFIYIEDLPDIKVYKTGDRGRMNAQGEIEILGRLDDQIKIRGYRIEIGEIEKVALKQADISEAIVKVHEDEGNNKQLVLYYTLKQGANMYQDDLKKWLSSKLPQYMLPNEYIQMDKMPTLPNGKINRKALNVASTQKTVKVTAPPKNVLEKQILKIWQEILQKDNVSIYDNFFDVGGTSLALMLVNNKLSSELGLTIPIMKLFEYPTIEQFVKECAATNEFDNDGFEDEFDNDGFDEDEFDESTNGAKENSKEQDIAIIGMAGRFPGANNIEEFWDNLMAGKESISFFTDEELLNSGIPKEMFEKENYVRAKGYLDGVEYFDADLFGYSAKEAEMMDPQIRLLHQCTYEVLENAGYDSFDYEGKIGMFAGSGSNLLWMTKFSNSQEDIIDAFEALTFNEKDFLTTKIAYKMNFKGPSVNVQTACSTSLVAVHQAVKSLINGEADMAVAGGVCISYPRKEGYLWHQGMIYSKDGHCRPFSDDATGTVAGNGCGVVLLKPLRKALEDHDHIYAIIKGSAVNNDGIDKIGYTAPSIKGQCEVIKSALDQSGIKPEDISYLEAHGTGTALGDPIEVEALRQAWHTDKKQYCALGSVKANIGHLDAASGIAGFIKAVLVLDKKEIPPLINFNEVNAKLDIENSPFYIATEAQKLQKEHLKVAVSSFGIGGTNAHVILEEAPQ